MISHRPLTHSKHLKHDNGHNSKLARLLQRLFKHVKPHGSSKRAAKGSWRGRQGHDKAIRLENGENSEFGAFGANNDDNDDASHWTVRSRESPDHAILMGKDADYERQRYLSRRTTSQTHRRGNKVPALSMSSVVVAEGTTPPSSNASPISPSSSSQFWMNNGSTLGTDKLIPSITIRRPSFASTASSSSFKSLLLAPVAAPSPTQLSSTPIPSAEWSIQTSSNVTTHSEDLTAKEFADLAGIRILSDDEEDDDNDDHHDYHDDDGDNGQPRDKNATADENKAFPMESREEGALRMAAEKEMSVHQLEDGSGGTTDDDMGYFQHNHQNTSRSILTSSTTFLSRHPSMRSTRSRDPQIWDAAFWSQPPSPSPSNIHYNQHSNHALPIMNELRRIHSTNTGRHHPPNLRRNKSCVIKKGRFVISLETADHADPPSTSLAT
ncbi:hypothetical protein BC940DRAFT_308781 [Gongronella butleri]|nr:hypothetical protein BC940DRAFT_308781 [Gongronella butleri]